MKKLTRSVLAGILACFLILTCAACGGDNADASNPPAGGGANSSAPAGNTPATDKTITGVDLESGPNKTEYYLGEEFDLTGAKIKVTYDDGSTEVLDLPVDGFDITEPDMSRVGEKTITVSYAAARARVTFKVSVMAQGFNVTFDPNYDGATADTVPVTKNQAVSEPAAPSRDGYTFYAWYLDAACTQPYDFSRPVTGDMTLYAQWKEDGAEYCNVTFDLNYYGVTPQSFPQIVKSGETATAPADPERGEYRFASWTTDAEGTAPFDPAAPITGDVTVYAQWEKTKSGTSAYVFEAEETDLRGKTGPGFSGSAMEGGMIVTGSSASNNRAVSYLYKNGNSLEFYIASDSAVSDATLSLSLAAEMDNVNFDSNEFQILVNGTALSYASVSLTNGADYSDAIVISGVSLKEGANTIQLLVNNNKRPMGEGSTYAATAPMVDCIKIETSAVLIWDANHGLPMSY